jgi:hypothetical protein
MPGHDEKANPLPAKLVLTPAPLYLTKRQQNQPLMVNALLSVVVYFLLQWHRVTVSFQVA